jgi:hypothetical protein
MEATTVRKLQFAAAQFVGIAALLHVGIGLRSWSRYAVAGIAVPPDVRVPLWTVSGMALLGGVVLAATRPWLRRPLYAGGAFLNAGYVVAYFSWHASGHRSLVPVEGVDLHGVPLVEFLLDHALAGPVEFVAIVAEVGAVVLLVALLSLDSGPAGAR